MYEKHLDLTQYKNFKERFYGIIYFKKKHDFNKFDRI